jgi:hypothetical protein
LRGLPGAGGGLRHGHAGRTRDACDVDRGNEAGRGAAANRSSSIPVMGGTGCRGKRHDGDDAIRCTGPRPYPAVLRLTHLGAAVTA